MGLMEEIKYEKIFHCPNRIFAYSFLVSHLVLCAAGCGAQRVAMAVQEEQRFWVAVDWGFAIVAAAMLAYILREQLGLAQ